MSSKLDTRVIQVTNVAPATTKEQLKTLFQFIGRIRECKLFPPDGSDQQVAAKVCYVEFEDSTSAGVSLHLTNTVFIDRALIVVPVMDGKIPDERVAMQLTPQTVAHMNQGQPSWPSNVVSQLTGSGAAQVITTYDPRLNALGLPQYPPLQASLDAAKVEEIRRTVYIGNLDPKTTPESLISFFSQAGEVKYVRMAGEEHARAAYLELTDQRSVATYLGYNGVSFSGRNITVSHAKTSINKPLSKSQEASRREVEEAMKKVQEAQSLISAAASEKFLGRSRSKSRRSRSRGYSRSRSRSRRRSRSRSKGRRRRSRSRSRKRSRSPRRPRRSRSRSPRRRRSRSRRRRSRSSSRPKRRSRSRSKRRSRTPPRAYTSRRSRSRSRGTRRKSRSRTPRRSRSRSRGKGKDRKDKGRDGEKKKEKKASVSRSPSPPTLQREGSAAPRSGDEGSPARLHASSKGEEVVEQSETVSASEPAPGPVAKKTNSEAASDKKSSKKRDRSDSPPPRRRKSVSRSPARGSRKRSGSRSPARGSRRRSASPRKRRSKSRSPRRSRSPAKKKKGRSPRRSRSGSRHRSKKDKKKERSRSRDRKEKEKKKKSSKEKREDREKGSSGKVTRDYDEEEKGFNSASDHEEEMKSQGGDFEDDQRSSGGERQLVDMDTSD